jgi:very-short-patch-repair endonuclease/ribosomal protein L37E
MSNKLTRENFIERATLKHNGIYNYDKVIYVNSKTKVIIWCKIHGEFEQEPTSHLTGRGCPLCGRLHLAQLQSKTREQFIEEAYNIHGDTYNYDKVIYVNSKNNIIIGCNIHGEFQQMPKCHLRGNGCQKCASFVRANIRRKKTEQFIEEANNIHGDTYNYDKVEYINTNTKVIIGCNVHGEFQQSPSDHIQGKGCPKCGILQSANIRRKTTDQFIEEAYKIHGDTYNYDKANYINTDTKVIIGCKIHGEFQQTPDNHLHGKGCPKCGFLKTQQTQTYTTTQFIKLAKEIHGDKYTYDKVEYINTVTKVIIGCKIHGGFQQPPNDHIQGAGCPKCGILQRANIRKKTTEKFIEDANKTHNYIYNYDKVIYVNSKNNVIIGCKIHGDFQQTPSSHLRGQECPKCERNIISKDEFLSKVKEIHGDKYTYDKAEYINTTTKIIVGCKIHGEFQQHAGNHLKGHGCSICAIFNRANIRRKPTEQFIEEANKKHNYIYNYDKVEYINCKNNVIIICNIHGEFEQNPYGHLIGHGCPYCLLKTEGKLRQALLTIYPNLETQFKQEWCQNMTTKRYLPFDFCLTDYKIIIELDGEQHFKKVKKWKNDPIITQKRDRYKMRQAIKNGYSVIRLKQEDVFNDTFDWLRALKATIKIIQQSIIPDVYTITELGDNSYDWIYDTTTDVWMSTDLDNIDI